MSTIRQVLRNKLIDGVGNIVYNSGIVTKETPKPYIIIRGSNETESNIKVAYDTYYNIFVYVEKGQHSVMDELINNVINTLNNTPITLDDGEIFFKYLGFIGQEYYDIDFDAFGQGLNFKTNKIFE